MTLPGLDLAVPAPPTEPAVEGRPTLADLKLLAGRATPRGIHPRRCTTCRQPILTGLDNDLCAVTVHVDYNPLNTLGEALAHIAGRATFELARQAGTANPRLTRRWARRITNRPPEQRGLIGDRYDVVPEHACHAPPLPGPASILAPTTTHAGDDAGPPPY